LIKIGNHFPPTFKDFMKYAIFSALLAAALSTAAVAAPVTGGGGGAAAPVVVKPAVNPAVNPNVNVDPGAPGRRIFQPGAGATPQGQVNATSTQSATSNNVAGGTNGFAGTNALGQTGNNPGSVTAAVSTNPLPIINTNTDINGNVVMGDQAVTASDRVLLTTLSQGVRATLGIQANGNLPVHFLIRNGTVTVTGTVQSAAQSDAILSQVQQTPGVISVANDLRVAPQFGVAGTPGNGRPLALQKDHAFSANDQVILTALQQQSAMQLGVNNASQMPVHFSVQNGIVGVSGSVASAQEKQALLAAVAQTPGVSRVADNVSVIGGATGFREQNTPSVGNRTLPPTSSNPNGTNTIFLNQSQSNNASGF
jgi:osmotically-inducible protein OsmY